MNTIDIVIPCYRYAHYLEDCVNSILGQDFQNFRILIVDDESPDSTPEVAARLVERDSRIHYLRNGSNMGHIKTYNIGINWVEAEYMLLLSADDFLLPNALGTVVHLMDAHPEMTLCFGEARELQAQSRTYRVRVGIDVPKGSGVTLKGEEFIELCLRSGASNIVPTPTAVVRSRFIKGLGGYRSDLPHSGDFEMWLRLAAHGSVGFVKSELAVYRRHGENMSAAYLRDCLLSDLQQRKAAFDVFLQTCRGVLPAAPDLHGKLVERLAFVALASAKTALRHRQMPLYQRLLELAAAMNPDIQKSWRWKMLSFRRILVFSLARGLRCLSVPGFSKKQDIR